MNLPKGLLLLKYELLIKLGAVHYKTFFGAYTFPFASLYAI